MATQAQLIEAYAKKEGVSPKTLVGVYGEESGYGSNPGTSSAGAQGPFQFLLSTGQKFGLNSTSIKEFTPSLAAAAAYLKELGANEDPRSAATIQALNNYNGNKGGATNTTYSQGVLEKGDATGTVDASLSRPFKEALKGDEGPLAEGAKGVEEGAKEVVKGGEEAIKAYETIVRVLTSPQSWLRLAEGVGGLVLLNLGLKNLTGASGRSSVVGSATQDAADVVALRAVTRPKRRMSQRSRRPSHERTKLKAKES